MFSDEWMNDECLEPNQLLAAECIAHTHLYIYVLVNLVCVDVISPAYDV